MQNYAIYFTSQRNAQESQSSLAQNTASCQIAPNNTALIAPTECDHAQIGAGNSTQIGYHIVAAIDKCESRVK